MSDSIYLRNRQANEAFAPFLAHHCKTKRCWGAFSLPCSDHLFPSSPLSRLTLSSPHLFEDKEVRSISQLLFNKGCLSRPWRSHSMSPDLCKIVSTHTTNTRGTASTTSPYFQVKRLMTCTSSTSIGIDKDNSTRNQCGSGNATKWIGHTMIWMTPIHPRASQDR